VVLLKGKKRRVIAWRRGDIFRYHSEDKKRKSARQEKKTGLPWVIKRAHNKIKRSREWKQGGIGGVTVQREISGGGPPGDFSIFAVKDPSGM